MLYEKYAGQRITIGAHERVLVRERNILGYLPASPKRAEADPPPLQFPLVTVKAGERSLMKRSGTAVALAGQHKTGALKPAAKKAATKAGKKAATKAAKQAGKKAAAKAAKKPGGKAATKTAAGAKKKAAAKKAKKKR